MKNIRLSIYTMFVLGLLASSAAPVAARVYSNYDCCQPSDCEPVYDCGCPLRCGSLNIWLRAGVAPLSWRDRGDFSAIACNALSIPTAGSAIVPILSPLPQFKRFFHLPWIAGGQLGYAFTDCFEFFVEFNYRSASRRVFEQTGVTIPNDVVAVTFRFNENYKVFDAYIGGRVYWGRYWCDRIALFAGAKFGLVHHKSICFDFNIVSTCPGSLPLTSPATTPFFLRNTRPAAGFDLGFDWCLGCGWSFMIIGEVVASCGPKTNGNIIITTNGTPGNCTQLPSILPSNLVVGGTGTELYFPVTIGFKYSF